MATKINQKGYIAWVVLQDGKIESGWEFTEDAKDQVRELKECGIVSKVLHRLGLTRIGIDPDQNANWVTGTDYLKET